MAIAGKASTTGPGTTDPLDFVKKGLLGDANGVLIPLGNAATELTQAFPIAGLADHEKNIVIRELNIGYTLDEQLRLMIETMGNNCMPIDSMFGKTGCLGLVTEGAIDSVFTGKKIEEVKFDPRIPPQLESSIDDFINNRHST